MYSVLRVSLFRALLCGDVVGIGVGFVYGQHAGLFPALCVYGGFLQVIGHIRGSDIPRIPERPNLITSVYRLLSYGIFSGCVTE